MNDDSKSGIDQKTGSIIDFPEKIITGATHQTNGASDKIQGR